MSLTTFAADNFAEAKSNRCVFENINGVVLEKVCEYLYYNDKHKDTKDVPDMDIPPELCLELLMAADYLNGEHPVSVAQPCTGARLSLTTCNAV